MAQQLAARLGPSREVEHRLRRTLRSLRHGPGVRRLHATERRLPRARGMCRPGCGTRGPWRGLAGLRGAAPNKVRPPSLAGGRALRRPEHQRHHKQHNSRHRINAPGHTKNRHPDRMSVCGGARGIRTPDLLIANETRYQLRHSPKDSNSLAP